MNVRSSAVVYLGPRSRASPTLNEGGRKLVCRTSIYERRGAIHQQSLAKRLPGNVHRVAAKYQVGRSELFIYVHKDLQPKYEVKISHVHDPNVRFKSFPFCNKSKIGLVSTYVSKMSESIKFKTKKRYSVQTNIAR